MATDELNENKTEFAQGKNNYTLLVIGCAIVAIGFLLMVGGKSEDPEIFNPEVFSPRRITLAPITVLAGYMFIVFAILKRPKH